MDACDFSSIARCECAAPCCVPYIDIEHSFEASIMFKIRSTKYRHVFCDPPKPEVSPESSQRSITPHWQTCRLRQVTWMPFMPRADQSFRVPALPSWGLCSKPLTGQSCTQKRHLLTIATISCYAHSLLCPFIDALAMLDGYALMYGDRRSAIHQGVRKVLCGIAGWWRRPHVCGPTRSSWPLSERS